MGKRRRARELAVQVLFHLDYNPGNVDEEFDLVCKNFHAGSCEDPISKEFVRGVMENREEVDKWISTASKNWRVERMSRVDRTVLRLATYEILYRDDIPPKVSIDEAVELGKKFGGYESGSFINGILDNIYNRWLKGEGGTKQGQVCQTSGPKR